jgi:Ca2+-binding RTX toxin-like protein
VSNGGSSVGGPRFELRRAGEDFIAALSGIPELLADIDGGKLGLALGSVLGKRISSDPLGQAVGSGTLSTLLGALGEAIDTGPNTTRILANGLDSLGSALLQNIYGAGVGALSAYLTAQLVDALDLPELPGEVANSLGSAVIAQIGTNIPRIGEAIYDASGNLAGQRGLFTDVTPNLLITAAASYLGNKLASEIHTFGSVGGQIGSAVGAAYAASLVKPLLLSGNPALMAAAVITITVANLLGGTIGSIFGGTPRSGADVLWQEGARQFTVANVYARKGGSKDAAKAVAAAVAENLNSVLTVSGASLIDPGQVQSGNYGMRSKKYVYRPISTRDKDEITATFTGKKAADAIITHGTFLALSSMVPKMAGGDVYVKRAIAASLAAAGGNPSSDRVGAAGHFEAASLVSDITVAQDYARYIEDPWIAAAIVADPQTVFSAAWLITLSRAVELGLNKRSATDTVGGFTALLDEKADGTIGGASLVAGLLQAHIDPRTGLRVWTIANADGDLAGYIGDTIEDGSLTTVVGTEAGDTIVITHSASAGMAVSGGNDRIEDTHGLLIDDAARDGSPFVIPVAASIDAGGGDDWVHAGDMGNNVFGGAGNDTLYGGRLDDWLLGGEGNDILHAGSQAGGLGGDGNYLDGGAGDDQVHGREGSDWLEGGEGVDLLDGGGGDDILTGGGDGTLADGSAAGDTLKGGHGGDQYLLRIGDGADLADESAAGAVLGNGAGAGTDRVKARFAGIAAGTIARNWRGDEFDRVVAEAVSTSAAPVVAAAGAGGDDAIVFGLGIGIGDVRLTRLGGANGADLLVEVIQPDADGAPALAASLTVRDWFADPFKRIEWLKFADGTEIRIGDFTSFVAGTAGGDVIIGTEGNDFVYAGDGDDEIRLLAGNDVGIGAGGDDLVSGDDGRDIVIGGTGADRLIGGRGEDTLSGDAGDDDLHAGADDDILSGGRGDDQMVGGAGDDVFKYARGDGRDTVFDAFGSFWTAIWSAEGGWINGFVRDDVTGEVTGPDGALVYGNVGTQDAPDYRWFGRFDYDVTRRADGSKAGTLYRYDQAAADASAAGIVNLGTDTIEFAIGISIQDVILTRTSAASDDLVLTITSENAEVSSYAAGADSITIRNWYASPGQIEKLAFYQTGVLAIGGAGAVNIVAATDANDGTMSAPLVGSAGADWITGGSGDDVVAGGSGDDIIAGNSGFDTLRGEGGRDVLYGGAGDDLLDGGLDADMLFGGAGMDAASYASVGVSFRAYLGFSWANTGSAAEGDEYDGIENLIGGSGSDGATTGDVLGGDEGDNEITGGRGDDILYGGAGDDSYLWNGLEWKDTIREGAYAVEQVLDKAGNLAAGYAVEWSRTDEVRPDGGHYWRLAVTGPGGELAYENALYAPAASNPPAPPPTAWDQNGWLAGFARSANGYQVLREKIDTGAAGGSDTIEFGAGITLADLSFERFSGALRDDAAGTDLVVRFQNSQLDHIRIENQYSAWGAVETLLFRDGFSVSLSGLAVAAAGATLAGTESGDFLVGAGGISAETLVGGLGNDVLSGLRGADILRGEGGDDVLEGGSGSYADTLDGGETEDEEAGDTVRYVRSSAVTVDLRLSTGQAGGEAAGDILIGIENVVGSATGGDVLDGDDGANRLDGLDGNNVIRGWGGDDAIYTGTGADLLYGGDGIDALSGGEGADQLWGDAGDDVLAGGAGGDRLDGGSGGDELIGGEGDDILLDGGDGDDTVLGEAGNDVLAGGVGKDRLEGGAGNDMLRGGEGDDEYLFRPGFGTDVLTDADGVNSLLLVDIPHDRIWLTQAGQDLRIAILGTTDVLTVSGFFAAAGGSCIRSIETDTHALFLDHEAVRSLIAAMSAASATTPAAMPAGVAAMLPAFWHLGGKAAPTAAAPAPDLAGAEDTPITFIGSWDVVDQDSDGLVYSVAPDGAPAHGSVAIDDPSTGALTYTPNADFNGEDAFTLLVKDAAGHSLLVPVRVVVEARDDGPRGLAVENGARLATTEQAATSATGTGSTVARLVATDPEGGAITWSMASENGALVDGGGRFAIGPDGLLVVADATLLDHEADGGQPVRIRVRATDGTGAATEQDFYVEIDDANEANSLDPLAAASVAEDVGVGTAVGQAHAVDVDAAASTFAQQRYFFLAGGEETALSADGRFEIDALTGIVKTARPLDFETAPDPLHYIVVARDNAGGVGSLRAETGFTITLTDANEQNRFAGSYEFALPEGVEAGAFVGQVAALDDDAATSGFAAQHYYFLSQGAASATSWDGRYSIDAETGIIRNNFAFDREAGAATVVYRVLARDNGGTPDANESSTDVSIIVGDVNEANAIPSSYEFAVGEDVQAGTVVAHVTATDADSEGVNAQQDYAFEHGGIRSQTSSDGRFAIDAATGAITLIAQLDSETMATGEYGVVVRDRGGEAPYHEASALVRIAIVDRNDPNRFESSFAFDVYENAEPDTFVGAVAAQDEDRAATAFAAQRYRFDDDGIESTVSPDGLFAIDPVTGRIRTVGALDHEQFPNGLTYRVVARDNEGSGAGFRAVTDVTISVGDINERPEVPALTTVPPASADEGAFWSAQFSRSDPDGTTPELVFVGNPGSHFTISGGQLLFAGGSAPDFETLYGIMFAAGTAELHDDDHDGLFELLIGASVKALDSGGLESAGAAGISVRIEDVNEAATSYAFEQSALLVSERDRPEFGAEMPAVTIGILSVSDPDLALLDTASYTFTSSDARFEIAGTTLRLKTGAALDYETGSVVTLTVTAADRAGGAPLTKTISIAVKNEDDFLSGTEQADTLVGQDGRDRIWGHGAGDTIVGGAGDDDVRGGGGDDDIEGGEGADELHGEAGADIVAGGAGDDILHGGDGLEGDHLYGGSGNDALFGGSGNDILSGGDGSDALEGGDGADTASYADRDRGAGALEGVTADLANAALNAGAGAVGDSYASVENLIGTDLADQLYGDAGANRIDGGGGDDHLYGRAGSDELYGGAGNDHLYAEDDNDILDGGVGNDALHGGSGADTYFIRRNSGADKIFEFNPEGTTKDVLQFNTGDLADVIEHHELWFELVNDIGSPDPAGSNVKVSLLGTATSATIMNWQVGKQYQIEFISTNRHFTRNIRVADLLALMSQKAKPASASAHLDMMDADRTYWDEWATLWETNEKPHIAAASNVTLDIDEGQSASFALSLNDDITPDDQIGVEASIGGTAAIGGVTVGGLDASGNRLITVVPGAYTSGTAQIVLRSRDGGDNLSDETVTVTVNIRGLPTRPTLTAAASASGTSGEAGGIAITLGAIFPDADGSEIQRIAISGLPAGVSLNRPNVGSTPGIWLLRKEDLAGLAVIATAGFNTDFTLYATAYAQEGGLTESSATQAISVSVNAPPTDATFSGAVVENSQQGSNVGTVTGTDPDGDPLQYFLTDAATSPFVLTTSGTLSVRNPAAFNFETANAHLISVRVEENVSDPAKRRSSIFTLSVSVVDANEQNSFNTAISATFAETVAINTLVGRSQALDPDSSATPYGQQRYGFLVGSNSQAISADGRLIIDPSSGEIRTRTALNFETGATLSYTVVARDNPGGATFMQAVQAVTITLTDVNEPNDFPQQFYTMSVPESAAVNDLVGTVTATDPDLPAQPTGEQRYFFKHSSTVWSDVSLDGRYKINELSGAITVNKALDHETMAGEVTYIVIARDNRGLPPFHEDSTEVKISVGNVNEPNSFTGSYGFSVAENTAPDVVIGTVAAQDPDGSGSVFGQQRYGFLVPGQNSLSNTTSDGRYRIGDDGKIRVNGPLDFEAHGPGTTYDLVAWDNAGGSPHFSAPTKVTISIVDVNEQNALQAPPPGGFAVAENVSGAFVGRIVATDPDTAGKSFAHQTYSFLVNNQAVQISGDGRYKVDAVTGDIVTQVALDHESMAAPAFYTMIARDNYGATPSTSSTAEIKIVVSNVAEAPAAPTGPATAFFNELPSATLPSAGTVFATYALGDPDGTVPQLQFASGGNLGGLFSISGGQLRFTGTSSVPGASFDYEWAKTSFPTADYNGDGRADAYIGEVKVQATDGTLTSAATTTHFYLSDVNERPNGLAPAPQTLYSEMVPGDPAHSGNPIATFAMSDPDGTTPSLRIVGGNPYGWFTTAGSTLKFGTATFISSWLRAYAGQYGMDAGFYYDTDGDGLLEIRVATLTLSAVDAGGLESVPISYNVYIEDKNEAPVFPGTFAFAPNENPAPYQQVGTIAATDVDGPAGSLRYYFAGAPGAYFNSTLGRHVSQSPDARFVVDFLDGRVWVNGTQTLDFEGANSFAYQTVVYDRDMGPNRLYGMGLLRVTLQDVNEPHALQNASFAVNEANVPLGPATKVPTTAGTVINLRDAMLADPESRNMRWQFGNGSTQNGAWQIEQDGTLRMIGAVDYEAMTDVYGEQEGPNGAIQTVWVGRDPSLAVVTLAVQAIDDSSGVVRTATLTINVADVNEDVTTAPSASYSVNATGAQVSDRGNNEFWVKGEVNEGRLLLINARDPEGRPLTYSLTNMTTTEISPTAGGNSDIDSGLPVLSIDATGKISFSLPYGSDGGKDSSWQGGAKTSPYGRRTLSVQYDFNVQIADSVGRTISIPYRITFLRRGASVPPVVFDLDGDGLELVAYDGSSVTFDMDGDGVRDVTGWVAGDDGLLALDRNGDGLINDVSEISFRRDDDAALTDLEGLRAFDSNANGYLDAGDARWEEFKIWRDSDQDGVSQAGELVTLSEAGIVNVNLTVELTGNNPEHAVDNMIFGTTQYQRADGTTAAVGDVFLAFDPSDHTALAAPIVIDYDGDGSGLVPLAQSSALFDMDGDGDRERTGWIAAGDALLVLDRNGDGAISDIAEISFVGDKAGATTDLEGLAAFDSDGDGSITTRDARYADFRLWFDNNGNGATDAGEILTLPEAEIAAIALTGSAAAPGEQLNAGNRIYARAAFTRTDGSTGTVLDAAFAYAANPQGTAVDHSRWTGQPTPSTKGETGGEPGGSSTLAPAAFLTREFGRDSSRYRLATQSGQLVIGPARPKGAADPGAGALRPASMLSFADSRIGYLAPLILDLDGDGAETRSRKSAHARFDMDGNGTADDTGWIGRGDGFLVIDGDGDGRIEGPAELSLLGLKADARNSFEALATLDSNKNGEIDAGDDRFAELKLWTDVNANGVTDSSELVSLGERSIASISVAAAATDQQKLKPGANAVLGTASFTRTDGSTGTIANAALAFRPGRTPRTRLGGPALSANNGNLDRFDAKLSALRSALASDDAFETVERATEIHSAIDFSSFSDSRGGMGAEARLPDDPAEALADAPDPRVARLIQEMAAFGARTGENDWSARMTSGPDRFDYYAA